MSAIIVSFFSYLFFSLFSLQEIRDMELRHKEEMDSLKLEHEKKVRDMESDIARLCKQIARLKKRLAGMPKH